MIVVCWLALTVGFVLGCAWRAHQEQRAALELGERILAEMAARATTLEQMTADANAHAKTHGRIYDAPLADRLRERQVRETIALAMQETP